jgi:PST family polysaccharide transporter
MWLLLSIFLRFINLPIGYVFLAKGKGKIFIFTQSFWNVIFLALVFFSWKILNNLEGIGIAYILANILAMVVNVFIIKKQTGLIYEKNILKNILILSIIIALYFSISYFFKGFVIFIFKIIGLIALVYYSFKEIEKLIAINIIDFIRLKLKKK